MTDTTTIERHPDGAKCEFCERRMLKADGCIPHAIVYELDDDDEPTDWEAAVPYTGIQLAPDDDDEDRCPDCGATRGNFHHPGCDWATDPRTRTQLLTAEFVEYRGLATEEEGR